MVDALRKYHLARAPGLKRIGIVAHSHVAQSAVVRPVEEHQPVAGDGEDAPPGPVRERIQRRLRLERGAAVGAHRYRHREAAVRVQALRPHPEPSLGIPRQLGTQVRGGVGGGIKNSDGRVPTPLGGPLPAPPLEIDVVLGGPGDHGPLVRVHHRDVRPERDQVGRVVLAAPADGSVPGPRPRLVGAAVQRSQCPLAPPCWTAKGDQRETLQLAEERTSCSTLVMASSSCGWGAPNENRV